jgi:hypothetical protein
MFLLDARHRERENRLPGAILSAVKGVSGR